MKELIFSLAHSDSHSGLDRDQTPCSRSGNSSADSLEKSGRAKKVMKLAVTTGLLLAAPFRVHGQDGYLDGSTVPTAPWQFYADDANNQTLIVDFLDPLSGATNQAIELSSQMNVTEWYQGAFAADEVTVAGRLRLTSFTPTGTMNLLMCTTTAPAGTNAPSPTISLVDGHYALYSYIDPNSFPPGAVGQEIMDLGPVDTNLWHTAYITTRSDGATKLWWDGSLVFDGIAPASNPGYGGFVEWGSGSWEFTAADTVDFDWVGYSTSGGAPILISTTPTDGNPYYDGSAGFSFSVKQSLYGVSTAGVSVSVNGIDRTADLVLTGENDSLQGSLTGGFAPNRYYQVVLTLTDLNSNVLTDTINFQTFSQNNYSFEAEDWNFNGGQWLDNIVISSIPNTNNYVEMGDVPGTDEVDFSTVGDGSGHAYRGGSEVGTETTGDWLRQKYIDAQVNDPDVADYDVGWIQAGEWRNYTRTFPAGKYNVYARLAYDQAAPFEESLSMVTGATTDNQTTTVLGSFKGTGISGGGQIFNFVPLTDANTNRVALTLGGVETLRATSVSSLYNANFYMLVPAEGPVLNLGGSGNNVVVSWYQVAGENYILQSAPTLQGPWSSVVNQSNPITLPATQAVQFFRLKSP